MKPIVVNEFGDIGVAVGASFIDGTIRAEVENGVHVIVLFGSYWTDRRCGQGNHTDVISQITATLNLANEKETILGAEPEPGEQDTLPQKPRGPPAALLGAEVAAVDEYQFAAVKLDRPPPRGARQLLVSDPNGMTADLTEIVDHDSGPFSVRFGVYPHPSADFHPICGTVAVV